MLVERIAGGDMRSPKGGSVWLISSACPSPRLGRKRPMWRKIAMPGRLILRTEFPRRWRTEKLENVSVTTARLQTIIALADEIGALSRKQLAAVSRGRDLAKGRRARLRELYPDLPMRWRHLDCIRIAYQT